MRSAAPPGCWTRRSPAGHAHMAGDSGPVVAAVDDEIVALGLARDCLADCRLDRFVTFGLAKRTTQIRRIFLSQAHIKRAGAGQADPVAALAEIMGQRCDKSEPPPVFSLRHVTRR